MTHDPVAIAAAADRIRDRIAAAGGDPQRIRLIAVTKGFGSDVVPAATAAGLDDLGESYAQELLAKVADLGSDAGSEPRWHFIGRLQSNKVAKLAPIVGCWHSLDRESVIRAVAERAPGARVLVQVNASGELHKGGADIPVVPDLVGLGRDLGLEVMGLMSVGVLGDSAATASAFDATAALADELGLPERSMGMSADLDEAVRAGTTMVRIGTALFGPRPAR